jgi:hypothetical protein
MSCAWKLPTTSLVIYDGSKKIEATDETFKDAGKVGLWTKADSVTHFDDLKITARQVLPV